MFSTRGRFKNTYELLNLRALNFSTANKIHMFQCMCKIFAWNFKGTLWNSTQNILPTHWQTWFLYIIEILRALRFKNSYLFLKRPADHLCAGPENIRDPNFVINVSIDSPHTVAFSLLLASIICWKSSSSRWFQTRWWPSDAIVMQH